MDPCYARVPEQDRAAIVEKAWQKGSAAAREVFRRQNGSGDFRAIVQNSGLQLNEKDSGLRGGRSALFQRLYLRPEVRQPVPQSH